MAQVKITLLGMFGYFDNMGDDLFKFLVLPEGMEKDVFTDTLFLDYGERAVLYTNPPLMQRMIGAWSTKWSLELSRIAKTLLDDYEPLWNIDRFEDVTDETKDKATESTNGTLSESEGVHNTLSETEGITGSLSSTNGSTNAQTVENTTSAYNSSQYEPDNKNQVNGSTSESINQTTGSNKTTSQASGSDKSLNQITGSQKANDYSRDYDHKGHYYGNGGVTSSQALVREELTLREKYNLYHEACKLFSEDLLLYMY